MEELRALGHWPSAGRQQKLLKQICEAMHAGNFSAAQTAEIEAMKKTMEDEAASKIMEQIRALGYIPKYSEHQQLARTYHQAVKDGKISSLDQEEAKKLTAAQYGR